MGQIYRWYIFYMARIWELYTWVFRLVKFSGLTSTIHSRNIGEWGTFFGHKDFVMCRWISYFYLFKRCTDQNSLLDYTSFHPRHIRDNIPVGQFLHLRKLCSSKEEYLSQTQCMKRKFMRRGYPERVVKRAHKRASNVHRDWLFLRSQCEQDSSLICVLPFSSQASHIQDLVLSHWDILRVHPVFEDLPIFSFWRGKNLRDLLVNTRFKSLSIMDNPGHKKCHWCVVCPVTMEVTSFTHSFLGLTHQLRDATDCNSIGVVYVVICPCPLLYIGQNLRPFKKTYHRTFIGYSPRGRGSSISYSLEDI